LQETPLSVRIGTMSFTEVLEELPGLTFEQRQLLVRRALELDEAQLTAAEEAMVETRLRAHHADPASSLSLEEMRAIYALGDEVAGFGPSRGW
jgi:uncharacterized protein Smg (DUF494 family)